MSDEGPENPQFALAKALNLVTNLRGTVPCKAGDIMTRMDEVAEALGKQDAKQFPFSTLLGEVDALRGAIRTEYGDYDMDVDRRSFAYEMLLSLQHRLRLSTEFYTANMIFRGVEQRYKRIDEALPLQHYALSEALSSLDTGHIGATTRQRLKLALDRFGERDWKAAIREATEAGEALFCLYKQRMKAAGCEGAPREQGLALNWIRRWMVDGNTDEQGLSFAPSGRVEWFLLLMFETLHYLRNAVSHPPETDERVPEWQRQRRAAFPEAPEHARLALCLAFQIALELQLLRSHSRLPT